MKSQINKKEAGQVETSLHIGRSLSVVVVASMLLFILTLGNPVIGTVEAQDSVGESSLKYEADPSLESAKSTEWSLSEQTFPFTPSQCQSQFGFSCYAPKHIRTAYNVPEHLTGAGQSISIVTAYGSPTVRDDLRTFSKEFGLPQAKLKVVYPQGRPRFQPERRPEQLTWAAETNLDVQWAHAIAPKAKINLVVASNGSDPAINRAQRYAINNRLGEVMSLSFGTPESSIKGEKKKGQLRKAHQLYKEARNADIGIFAASGNTGAESGYEKPNAVFPASDPLVTAVGGTALFANDNGDYVRETVWNDSVPRLCPFKCKLGGFRATGGAPSKFFSSPPYQKALAHNKMRTTSDVAYNASDHTGVLVYLGYLGEGDGFYFSGGTSAGAPQWAAIAALANEAAGYPLGFLNPKLYQVGSDQDAYSETFNDITVGRNGISSSGFRAGTGYDEPTGLGTPNVEHLISELAR